MAIAIVTMFAGASASAQDRGSQDTDLQAAGPETFDLMILGGRVHVDGETPPRRADVGVRDGRIVAVERDLADLAANRSLDAAGLVIAPGFIDAHTHADGATAVGRGGDCRNFVTMGVTTLVTGNCGGSVEDLAAHFARLERQGISANYASLVGHGTVRRAVMGTEQRAPTAEELEAMREQVRRAMAAGAVGMSTGLIYVPGTYATTDELVALCEVVAEHGGVYATHMRNEAGRVLTAIDEALDIGFRSGVHVHLSHLKASGKPNWGKSSAILSRMRSARALGQAVTGDQYAYCASSTGLEVLFPSAELSIGLADFGAKLAADAAFRTDMTDALLDTAREADFDGGFRYAQIAFAPNHPELSGLRIDAAAQHLLGATDLGTQCEAIAQMMTDAKGQRVQMVYHKMCEPDLESILAEPSIAVASDSGIRLYDTGQRKPHPRGAGNNPRVLGRYVRERQVISLERAIDKMTRLPAEVFGLQDRGQIHVGAFADFTIFDPDTVLDGATYEEPLAPPTGIRWVVVGGVVVVEDNEHSGARPGKILRSSESKAARAASARSQPQNR